MTYILAYDIGSTSLKTCLFRIDQTIEAFRKHQIDVFKGNYVGVNPDDPSDSIDLSQGYTENKSSSSPSFRYILKDIITVEN